MGRARGGMTYSKGPLPGSSGWYAFMVCTSDILIQIKMLIYTSKHLILFKPSRSLQFVVLCVSTAFSRSSDFIGAVLKLKTTIIDFFLTAWGTS